VEDERIRHPRFDLSRILVVGLEATCWKGPRPPDEDHEIIEIGNAILHVGDLQVEPGPEILVRPTRSGVSEFCTELTSLTPGKLEERGVAFPDAIQMLETAHGKLKATVWASYGDYDRRMLTAECERHGVEFPLSNTHLNVKRLVALMSGWSRETGLRRALNRLGLEPTPGSTFHRGADDAANIGRLLGMVLGGGMRVLLQRPSKPRGGG